LARRDEVRTASIAGRGRRRSWQRRVRRTVIVDFSPASGGEVSSQFIVGSMIVSFHGERSSSRLVILFSVFYLISGDERAVVIHSGVLLSRVRWGRPCILWTEMPVFLLGSSHPCAVKAFFCPGSGWHA
jgi:hypothetical protein